MPSTRGIINFTDEWRYGRASDNKILHAARKVTALSRENVGILSMKQLATRVGGVLWLTVNARFCRRAVDSVGIT